MVLPRFLLAIGLLASGLQTAHAGGVPSPSIDGQTGFGPPVVSADGSAVALTRWDRSGLWAWDTRTGQVTTVSDARGAGFHPVWDGDALLFKAVYGGERIEAQALRWEAGALEVLDEGLRVGQPFALSPGQPMWARPEALRLRDGRDLPAVGDVDLVAPSPGGRPALAWNDDTGLLYVRDVATGLTHTLSGAGPGSHPAWSDDGALLLHRGHGGDIVIVDPATGLVRAQVPGTDPAWVPGTHDVVYSVIQTPEGPGSMSPYTVLDAALWSVSADTGAVTPVFDDPSLHARYPTPFNGDLLFVESASGDLYRLHAGHPVRVMVAPRTATAAPPPPSETRNEVYVPYMHQLWDTPDDFDGGWSCGPTSVTQTLARWNVLPTADITCSWPSPHTSHWGWYIPNNYNFAGYQYDVWGIAPGGQVQGAHGFICRSYGGAIWADLTLFMQQHGVDSAQVGTDYNYVINETNAGYPVYASVSVLGYGHILVVRGYLAQDGSPIHSMIVNDPYGNAGSGDWGNFDGEDIVYDWPGYNNGHLEIGVSTLFTAHGPSARVDTGGSDPVDTGTPPDDGGNGDGSSGGTTGGTTGGTDTAPPEDTDVAADTGRPDGSGGGRDALPGEAVAMTGEGGCHTGSGMAGLFGVLVAMAGAATRRRA